MAGHGWVTPLPGGAKARCGGPPMCPDCAREQAASAGPTPRKYRKRPVVIEAFQWHEADGEIEPIWFEYRMTSEGEKVRRYFITTLEGVMAVSDGDYIITGIKGEKYPCKQDIFEATYDLVPEYPRDPYKGDDPNWPESG